LSGEKLLSGVDDESEEEEELKKWGGADADGARRRFLCPFAAVRPPLLDK
jgi:hypothetical protein